MGELTGSPLPSESCNNSAVDGIVLHLRATFVDLWIIRSKWHPARAGCDIMRSRSENLANDKLGHVKLDEAVAAKYCDEEAHEFVLLDTMLMLVEKYGAFYERIALGSTKLVSDDCRQRMTAHIQRWGREKHVKLR
ncbi:hypothetical protein B0A55_06618 [Friedmanniomyces simplex]|uniref:Uncharacterized protein n=1 Tax=Friedmanniomyces simplex TaxID=329884 RepID=A0A4U0X9H9_9PEZI|nr:hypothetical protein B0A55_06618 [Friedmanniomyces simplex]